MKPIHVISAVIGGAIAGAAVGLLVARRNIIEILKKKGINLKCNKMEELAEEIEDQLEKQI